MSPPLTFLALFACAEAIWRRRTVWECMWDRAVTVGVVLEGVNIVCMEPSISSPLSPWLHRVTGVWNVQQLGGHLLHIGGLMCVLYMAISRLKLTAGQRRKMLRKHIELPAVFIVAVEVALFVEGAPDKNIPDLVLTNPSPIMWVYWVVMGVSALYISITAIWALSIIARNAACAATANVYIFVCSISVSGVLVGLMDLVDPSPNVMLWSMARIELIAYSCAALNSWYHRRPLPDRGPTKPAKSKTDQ